MMRLALALTLACAGCTVQTRADLRREAWATARRALDALCEAHQPESDDGLAYYLAWAALCGREDGAQ